MKLPIYRVVLVAYLVAVASPGQILAAGENLTQVFDWRGRVAQFEETKAETSEQTAARKLVELLRRENQFVNFTLSKGDWPAWRDSAKTQKYADYYAELFDSVLKLAPVDPSAYVVLAQGAYDPHSDAADKILEKSELVWFAFVKDARNPSPIKRAQAIEMLGKVAAERRHSLSEQNVAEIKLTFKSALKDREYLVRSKAIDGVVSAGFNDLVPALKEVALSDRASTSITGYVSYPVREEAQNAIYKLQGKSADK